jgi:hypothetical protein
MFISDNQYMFCVSLRIEILVRLSDHAMAKALLFKVQNRKTGEM